jgi:hypothetical protein
MVSKGHEKWKRGLKEKPIVDLPKELIEIIEDTKETTPTSE